MRLGQRDIDGLILCAEHYGAPYDLLAAALGAQPARLRAITSAVAAGRVRRHRAAGTRPRLVLAHPGRDERGRVRLPGRAAVAGPAGAHPRRTRRPALAVGLPGLGQGRPWWHSERRIRAARPPGPAAGHVPDAEIHWPSIDASPYAGQVWAVEVELTPKAVGRAAQIMTGLLSGPRGMRRSCTSPRRPPGPS